MKHCLLITAYKDSELINRFISKVPDDWGIFVHIDRKSSINALDISNKAITKKIYKVYWGSIEHVKAYIYLMKLAIMHNYDYYHLVTGQDYFASNPSEFDSVLGNEGINYIDIFTLPRANWRDGDFSTFKIKTLSSFGDIRFGMIHKLDRIFTEIQRRTKNLNKVPNNWKLYGGSVYCSLHHSFVNWVLNSELTYRLLDDLKNTTCGEELFFQTLIMCSPFKYNVNPSHLRYIDWTVWSPPKILTIEDFEKITSNNYLFCRKIDTTNSMDLCTRLDSHLKL